MCLYKRIEERGNDFYWKNKSFFNLLELEENLILIDPIQKIFFIWGINLK